MHNPYADVNTGPAPDAQVRKRRGRPPGKPRKQPKSVRNTGEGKVTSIA